MSKESSVKITLRVVESLAQGQEIRDSQLKGFGVRRRSGAAIVYFVQRRVQGKMQRVTIGRHGVGWTAETARKEAARLLGEMQSGRDLAGERRDARAATITVESVAKEFSELHVSKLKPRTRETYGYLFRRQILPVLGHQSLSVIDRTMIERAHKKWGSTPRTANHALTVLRKMLVWAEERGLCVDKYRACEGIRRYREKSRERFLSDEEFGRLGVALRASSVNVFVSAAIRLLTFTGARKSEILELRWDWVDLERRALILPDSKTGAKVIQLGEVAVEVLSDLPRIDGNPYVLPGHVVGSHLVNISKSWVKIRKEAGLEGVRIHDLRHSFASAAVNSGASLPMIGKLLGHARAETTERYAHLADTPVRRLVESTSRSVKDAFEGVRESNTPSPAITDDD